MFWHVAPPGEPANYATIGYLSDNGRILVNACNTIAQRPVSITAITPSGSRIVSGLPFPAPQLLDLDFTDIDGQKYNFLFDTDTLSGATTPIGVYANGLGTVTGGRVGIEEYSGTMQVQYFATTGSE